MTKFINNLCLYLLHAVFSLVKPAISNTYLILMGFFQVFLQLHSSFKSKQQASHSSITPKFQGQCTSVQKGTRHRPCRFHFCKSNACQLAACFVPTAVAAYIVGCYCTQHFSVVVVHTRTLPFFPHPHSDTMKICCSNVYLTLKKFEKKFFENFFFNFFEVVII